MYHWPTLCLSLMGYRPIRAQRAFTLIELMVVVAIIGVLSAVAIPTYQNYKSKSEVTMGVNTLNSLLTNIDLYIQDQGTFPEDTNLKDLGIEVEANRLGKIVLTPDTTDTTKGQVSFTFDGDSSINGTKVVYQKKDSWECEQSWQDDYKLCGYNDTL